MTGPLNSMKRIGETNNVQASGDAFSEQLALRVAALVRELAAGHEVLLRSQLLEEKDTVSMLRSENTTLRQKLDVGNIDLRDGNIVASEVPPPDATCDNSIPMVRFEADNVVPGGFDADYPDCVQPHHQFFDVPRLQQVERAFETPQVPESSPRNGPSSSPRNGPSSARSGRTKGSETSTVSVLKSDTPSLVRTRSSASVDMVHPFLGNKDREKMKELVQIRFKELDCRRAGKLNAENLRSCVQNFDHQEVATLDCRITDAIEAFNKANTRFQPNATDLQELTFEGFFHIMVTDDFDKSLGPEEAAVLTEIRTVCVNEAALELIATKAMVSTKDITGERQKSVFCSRIMEPTSGFVICINALCIGIQLDIAHNWMGWQILEMFFTCFFIFELTLKMRYSGVLEMFLGDDWRWNIFDTLIVILATVDMCFFLGKILGMEREVSLRNVSIMRLSRLMRITRVVRLLKLHFFKDLTIMINGVFGGLKTLFWAFVLLIIIVYVVGVMLRQVIVTQQTDCKNSACQDAEEHLTKFEHELFSSVGRSMFTVFRCLTDGCSSADGTPLVLYFWDTHGLVFVMVYVLVLVFILFGVFNLIMAIFVEKTLEYAKLDTAKRREARYKEEVRIAKEFRSLVLKIVAHQHSISNKGNRKTTGQQNMENFMSGFRFAIGGANGANIDGQQDMDQARVSGSAQLTIGREHFELIMNEEEIRARMEDLEISVTSSAKLFDILDSNGSGSVDVVELTEGLMSLRGPADKGDIISGSLLVKSTQKMVRDMQDEMTKCIQKQNCQIELLHKLNANVKSRMATESCRVYGV